jgi:hypothetical protein
MFFLPEKQKSNPAQHRPVAISDHALGRPQAKGDELGCRHWNEGELARSGLGVLGSCADYQQALPRRQVFCAPI